MRGEGQVMINVLHNMIVFPRLTAFCLSHLHDKLLIDNSKVSGRYLTSKVVDAMMTNTVDELPDISIYYVDDRRWKDLYVPSEDSRKIRLRSDKYTYYPKLMCEEHLSLALSFLLCHSDARISLLNTEDSAQSMKLLTMAK